MATPTWGDSVRVKVTSPATARPRALAAVVGVRAVETSEQASQFASPLGTTLFLFEFGDGVAIEVPESWIEPEPVAAG
jgi:hypothetical protein